MNAAAQTAHNPASSSAELYRLLCNLLRVGTVQLVDHANAKIRVQTGGLTTHWVRWLEHRAGHTVTWSPPTVGEQVLLLSPGGDLSAAIALRGLYSDAAPAPTAAPTKTMCAFPDGATITYDHAAHALQFAIGGCTHTFSASGISLSGGGVAISGGGVTSDGDQIAGGISQITHTHSGVVPGPANTGAPA